MMNTLLLRQSYSIHADKVVTIKCHCKKLCLEIYKVPK